MNKKQKQKLHKIYRKIPNIECKGLCTDFCGAIGMEKGEAEAMVKQSGKMPFVKPKHDFLPKSGGLVCGYLEKEKCSVYENRPLICRAFGVSEGLTCPHGCKTERVMTFKEFVEIGREVKKIAGESNSDDIVTNCTPEDWENDLQTRRYKEPQLYSMIGGLKD